MPSVIIRDAGYCNLQNWHNLAKYRTLGPPRRYDTPDQSIFHKSRPMSGDFYNPCHIERVKWHILQPMTSTTSQMAYFTTDDTYNE